MPKPRLEPIKKKIEPVKVVMRQIIEVDEDIVIDADDLEASLAQDYEPAD